MMNRIMFASEQLMAAKSAVSRVEAVIQEKTLPEAAQKQKPTETGIVFKNVSFSYPRASEKALDVKFSYEKDKPVLRDVSFTAKQGQVTALVGDRPEVERVELPNWQRSFTHWMAERSCLAAKISDAGFHPLMDWSKMRYFRGSL